MMNTIVFTQLLTQIISEPQINNTNQNNLITVMGPARHAPLRSELFSFFIIAIFDGSFQSGKALLVLENF